MAFRLFAENPSEPIHEGDPKPYVKQAGSFCHFFYTIAHLFRFAILLRKKTVVGHYIFCFEKQRTEKETRRPEKAYGVSFFIPDRRVPVSRDAIRIRAMTKGTADAHRFVRGRNDMDFCTLVRFSFEKS